MFACVVGLLVLGVESWVAILLGFNCEIRKWPGIRLVVFVSGLLDFGECEED